MSNAKIEVEFYYGDEDFKELMGKIIWQKIIYDDFCKENSNKICYSKDNRITAIYQKINKR